MFFENFEFVELKYFTILLLPILIIISPSIATTDVDIIHRLTQFDTNDVQFGSRFSNLNLEIRSLETWSTGRHCVLTKMEDLTLETYNEITKKAGGLIIQLPKMFNNLSTDTMETIYQIEQNMLSSSVKIPVYFSPHNENLDQIISDINVKASGASNSNVKSSAISDLMLLISSNGYQAITSGSDHTPNKKAKLPIIQGELVPSKNNKNSEPTRLSTIVITASINPFRISNHVSFNPDAALLLILIDFFSKLYSNKKTTPNHKIIFLLSESGSLLNFQGTKKWLDDNQVQDVDFVMCLDTIIQPTNLEDENSLYMHVSKPPKEGTVLNSFYKLFKETGEHNNKTIEGVHKKINLAEPHLAWEHERFGIKKITSFTLSTVKNYKSNARNTIFTRNQGDLMNSLQSNAEVIIQTLTKLIFDVNDERLSSSISKVSKKTVESWIGIKSTLQNNDVKNAFERYLRNVKVTFEKPDYRDPDFMLYNGAEAQLNIYNVKPAIFDLFLTILIASYLCVFYFVLNYFPNIYNIFKNDVGSTKISY
ncbi:NCLN family protein [Megaselia abdita]